MFAVLVLFPFVDYSSSGLPPTRLVPKSPISVSDEIAIVRGPTVNLVSNSSAVIFWTTDVQANATVRYGWNASLEESVSNSTLDTTHYLELSNLRHGTRHYYQIESALESDIIISEIYNFTTAPSDGGSFTFIVIGDNRPTSITDPIQPDVFGNLVDLAVKDNPHLVLMTGDYVHHIGLTHLDNVYRWGNFTSIIDRLGHITPVYGVVGNHDVTTTLPNRGIEYFLDAFMQPGEPSTYFSFDYAGAHFVFLDSEELGFEGRITGTQYNWLVEDLAQTRATYKFLFAHRPLYPISHVGSALDVNITERDRLQSLLEQYNFTAFISGHDHLYDRLVVNGVAHFISGGGGAPLYSSPFGGSLYHYLKVEVSHDAVEYVCITDVGEVHESYSHNSSAPIDVYLRSPINGSSAAVGSIPEIYFSEVPTQVYFSWDGGANETTLSGLPEANALHELRIYTENPFGLWSSFIFQFTTTGSYDDFDPPYISNLERYQFNWTDPNKSVRWNVTEEHPRMYTILRNETVIVVEYSWNGPDIIISVNGVDLGVWNYTLHCFDTSRNEAVASIVVTILDVDPPVFLSTPDDLTCLEGIDGLSFLWTPNDSFPASFVIVRNGSLVDGGAWDGGDIQVNVSGLVLGVYNFTLIVYDTSGNQASDTVIVTVNAAVTTTIPTTTTTTENTNTTTGTIGTSTGPQPDQPMLLVISLTGFGVMSIAILYALHGKRLGRWRKNQ